MLRFLFLSGILYLLIVSVYSQNVTRYENEGDSIMLKCPLTPPSRTSWRGPPNNNLFYHNAEPNPKIVRGERLSVMLNTTSGAYNLRITNLTIGVDDGMFICEVNTVPAQQYFFSLKFNIAVHNISLMPNSNLVPIIEGKKEQFKCEVNKNAAPDPVITWYLSNQKDTSIIARNTSIINITGNRTDNFKTLKCQATNNNNKTSKTAHTVLNVEYSPSLTDLNQQDIIEGRDLLVNCTATPGNPNTTTFYWSVGTNQVIRNASTLQVTDIQRTSSGTYVCTAENIYSNGEKGSDSQTMVVNVQYPPVVSTLAEQNIIEGSDLDIACIASPGNPNLTSFLWTKYGTVTKHTGAILQLRDIHRNSSGSYRCTASNIYTNGEEGTHFQLMVVNVLYPPLVKALSNREIREGQNLNVTCEAIPGNPNHSTIFWTKKSNLEFRKNNATLMLPKIQRNSTGTYICTAQNDYGNEMKGNHSQSMDVNVLFKPEIANKSRKIVNENAEILLSREIVSNPLSDVSWFNGSILLRTQLSVTTATYNKENAACTDTANFTLIANNGVGGNVTAFVELIVNCKPQLYANNITLGVTDATGIEFSTTVIAYPEPWYELENENGTRNTKIMSRITSKAVNIFTINFNQSFVNQEDYGTYYLRVGNIFGNRTVFINVIPQRRPTKPKIILVDCEERRAIVKWKSSFNGGDSQSFNAFALDNQRIQSESVNVSDTGENEIHSTYINNLKPSVTYVFYVSAKNRHGSSLSTNISCTTFQESSNNLPLIAGGAAAGGIAIATIVIVIVLFIRIYKKHEKRADKSQRFENEVAEKEADDDGMKDNILYVSAGPNEDEKAEAAVYAAVNKKAPESNNNANMYAEVNKGGHLIAEGALYSDVKPKRGLFKKDVGRKRDGNPKQKKGKKQKSKQDVADVYENSEDIAMSSKSDNVYSNTGQKVQNKEERGYKNKDGLLYVEVQFDTKNEKGNQTIHGEDEKTDYATVEFPMAASTHDESGNEKI